jgi:ABC-type polysaccharide/polyol phosphate transport system ATPase subunit
LPSFSAIRGLRRIVKAAIQFDGVSKKFTLHHERARSFQELALGLFRRNSPSHKQENREEFWALRDVSFNVVRGETVGLVGPNGAGKSTALKLISRIIEPTSGRVAVNGRVGALLELGAGFHPDLTGRENIFMNGSILGLSRAAVQSKLDDIIAFAELERFIDMPVKHYSSGMYMRLGFSVAVHTEPEVLLVDEVLSVGDASFQQKCLDRIAGLRRAGVTILLVSHSLTTVQSFCDRAIWFDKGRARDQGKAIDVVMSYLGNVAQEEREKEGQATEQAAGSASDEPKRSWGTGRIRLERVELYNGAGTRHSIFETGDFMEVRIYYNAPQRVEEPIFGLAIHHQNGAHICGPNTQLGELSIPFVEGQGVVAYRIPVLNLLEGSYLISVAVVNKTSTETFDYHDRLYPFRVFRGKSRELYGLFTLNGEWSIAPTL